MINTTISTATDTVVQLINQHTQLAAILVAWIAAWVLYGVLGQRYLGADDDFWEAIRARVIPILSRVAKNSGLYAVTDSPRREFAGFVEISEDGFESKLKETGYLRQPLASLHRNERGWKEDGSWSRPHGLLFPVGQLIDPIPGAGPILRRFISSLDSVLARRQSHIVFYSEQRGDTTRIHVYCHDEPNPINPLTAMAHYRAVGFRATPEVARRELAAVGVELEKPQK